MTKIPDFEMIVHAHGHTCPGIALGYKIAVRAAEWAGDEENISVFSTSARCPLDALRTTFHLREHPERLTVDDTNQLHFILTKPDGRKLFIDEIPGTKVKSVEGNALRVKMQNKTATPADVARFDEIQKELLQQMLNTPDEKLFTVREE